MKQLIEQLDGKFRAQKTDGETTYFFGEHEKESETYTEKLSEGFELVELPQAEKDAHTLALNKEAILAELSGLDLPLHTLARAMSGDSVAKELIEVNEAEKELVRARLRELG